MTKKSKRKIWSNRTEGGGGSNRNSRRAGKDGETKGEKKKSQAN